MGKVIIPYKPRISFAPYHDRTQRFALTVAHRRAGKTVAEVNDAGRKCMTIQRQFPPPQVAFISPTYKQSKRNAWPYAKHFFSKLRGVSFNESELTVRFENGGRYLFVGSDNPDALRGLYLDHASLDEYGDQSPRTWDEVVRPALSDYKGSATFIGSARGRNHFYKLLKQHEDDKDWLITILRASQTGILDEEELALARKTMTPEAYAAEYECSFDAALRGAYYSKLVVQAETEGRIKPLFYEPTADVYACWDLGIGDSTAIWIFQVVAGEWRWLRYYEASGQKLDHYAEWIKSLPYGVTKHFLPHDAEARELQTGTSRVEFLEKRGFKCEVVPRANPDDRISAVQLKFHKFFFDPSTELGLDCLRMYRAEYDEKKLTLKPVPLHDWASHGADAFGCGVVAIDDSPKKPVELKYDTKWVI